MSYFAFTPFILVCLIEAFPVMGQLRPVPKELLGERLMVVVPMIGSGKPGDPIRSKYTDAGVPDLRKGQPFPPEPKKRSAQEQFERLPDCLNRTRLD